jgi:steroid delta-isomerase-like uncharacterized protein
MSAENKKLAERFHTDLFQTGNLDAVDEILSPNFVIHSSDVPESMRKGRDGARRLVAASNRAFPDRKITHHDVLAQGDKVMIRWSLTGTHQGDLFGIPATGKTISTTGFDLFRIENGTIAEMWQNQDVMGMMNQLGLAPSVEFGETATGRIMLWLAVKPKAVVGALLGLGVIGVIARWLIRR